MEAGVSLPNTDLCSHALWPQHLALAFWEPARAEPGVNPRRPGMGGASRRRARLCPPPHPTLPRDRKAEPRFPELPPPLSAVAVPGWWRFRIIARDGRGCRYGDR